MKLIHSFIGAAAIAMSFGFMACQGSSNNENAAADDSQAAVEEVAEAPAEAPAAEGLSEATIRPDSKVERLTIIDFNAVWCGPCKKLTPVFKEAEETYAGKVDFFEVDIEKYEETAAAFGVTSVPTVVFIKPDGTVKQFVGINDLLPADKFTKLVEESL